MSLCTAQVHISTPRPKGSLNPHTQLRSGGKPINPVGITEGVTWILTTPKEAGTEMEARFRKQLRELTDGPLKPQQRLYTIVTHSIIY